MSTSSEEQTSCTEPQVHEDTNNAARPKQDQQHPRQQQNNSITSNNHNHNHHHHQDNQGATENQYDDNRPKRNPFCSRCRNHGKSAQVKGHKRHCEYRDCQCEGCKLVEVRQLVSAAQIKRRRDQKQDEECGRRIEISPPVLARELDARDPAALIAKTLIGSSAKNIQLQRSSSATSKHPLPSVIRRQTSHPLPPPHHHHHHHPYHNPLHLARAAPHHSPPIDSTAAVAAAAAAATIADHLATVSSTNSHQQSTSHQQQQQQQQVPPSPSSGAYLQPSLPSIREQIKLVEEIHYTYGPMAIYAWLKAEKFDHQKVRDLIEIARSSYDSLSSSSLLNNYNSTSNNNNNNNSSSCVDRNNSTITAASHTSLPLAETLNSLPVATAQGLFWPGFKMSTNAAGAAVIHPHHFLPHFMQHPFGTAAAAYHNQANHHQYNQHQQQLSLVNSSVTTNSSSSASSSSAVL